MIDWLNLLKGEQQVLYYTPSPLCRSGGNLEIMGLLLGKVDANVMVVMDSFALPVEGTETRVNAQAQG